MGYQMPIVCKELYLPIPSTEATLQEYKDLYGIDLRDFIELDEDAGYILFKIPYATKTFLVAPTSFNEDFGSAIDSYPSVHEFTDITHQAYSVDDETDARTIIRYWNDGGTIFGLKLGIKYSKEFKIENIKINIDSDL